MSTRVYKNGAYSLEGLGGLFKLSKHVERLVIAKSVLKICQRWNHIKIIQTVFS